MCVSASRSECEGIQDISDKLKTVYKTNNIRIVEDIKSTTAVIEKIVDSITEYNFKKSPKVG